MSLTTQRPVDFDHPVDGRAASAASAGRVRFVEVPDQRFLVIDGTGAPGDAEFREAMSALYPVAYTLHFALKGRGVGAPVGTLEGLYWTPDAASASRPAPAPSQPAEFRWRLMLPIPAEATTADLEAAMAEVRRKKAPPSLDLLRVEALAEGACAQILHVGPYDAEGPTLERLRAAIQGAGFRPQGPHHEIYVSDPGRTPRERLKTVIRQPVARAGSPVGAGLPAG